MKRFIVFLAMLAWLVPGHTTTIKSGETITINKPVDGDLYIAGNQITIEAVIRGDLIGAGGEIYLRDTIVADAILAGGSLIVEAPIQDDARLAGGKVIIKNDIFGDLVIAGGEVEIGKDVTVHGDLYIGGGEVAIEGRIVGLIDIGGGEVFFAGEGMSATTIKAGELEIAGILRGPTQITAHNLKLNAGAQFYQAVTYWQSAGELDFGAYLQGSATATFDEGLQSHLGDRDWRRAFRFGAFAFLLYKVLSTALLIVLLIWAFHTFFEQAVANVTANVLTAFGYGLLYLFALPVLLVIAFISIVGIPTGLALGNIYLFSLSLSHILAAILFVYWLSQNSEAPWSKGQKMLSAIGIYVLLKLVTWIPFVGWFISLLVMAVALGILLFGIFRKAPGRITLRHS